MAKLAAREPAFTISHRPADDDSWVELLINGLTFDLTGLAPAAPAAAPPVAHRFGVPVAQGTQGEAISLAPGPHLAGGATMPPVIRGAIAVALGLARLKGVELVCWHPARSAMGQEAFTRSTEAWLDGGPLPALGLTSLYTAADGRMCSEGLWLFIGQELCLERGDGLPVEDAKLALRLIDRLVDHGRVAQPLCWAIDDATDVDLEPDAAGKIIRAWRRRA